MIMNTFEDLFSEYAGRITDTVNEQESVFIQYCKLFSSIITDSFYVLDIVQKQFCYIKPDNLFLCDHSVEEAMRLGHDFYTQIIHPDDLPLWTNILKIIPQYLNDRKDKWNEIDYFSCIFRLLRKYSFSSRFLSQMVYQRMKPICLNNQLRYLICIVGSSTHKETGNLLLHNKNISIYEEYNFITRRWKQQTRELLTEREKAILMLAQQGKSMIEIASDLCKGEYTIRNQIKVLYTKLEVHSMQEAIEFACAYRLLNSKRT